jgi:hypothetical protein
MSSCSRAQSLRALAAFGASLCAAACFDVKRVEVTSGAPVVIDDFDDGDQNASNEFDSWGCYSFVRKQLPCLATTGAEAFTFVFDLPTAEVPVEKIGVGVGVFDVAGPSVDLRPWATLRFDAKFEPSVVTSVDRATLWVRLKCVNVDPPGSVDSDVEWPVDVGRAWSPFATPLSKFQQPAWQPTRILASDCLASVDVVAFEMQLADESGELTGQSGTLTLDNVSLE